MSPVLYNNLGCDINTPVNNCIDLNLFDKYQLMSVIYKSGSENSGHYVCVKKVNNQFYLFNDNSVSIFNDKIKYIDNFKYARILLYKLYI